MNGADLAKAWFEHSPFIAHLGLRLVDIAPDEATVEMPASDALPTAGDIVHGGAISSLADTAAAAAAWSSHDPQNGVKWGTVSVAVTFQASGRGTLRARAWVTRRTRSMCFCTVDVTDEGGTVVASAVVAYRIG